MKDLCNELNGLKLWKKLIYFPAVLAAFICIIIAGMYLFSPIFAAFNLYEFSERAKPVIVLEPLPELKNEYFKFLTDSLYIATNKPTIYYGNNR